jgi:hypothetical protein|tara:strand:+ start:2826 stop:3014 length:189 start_codon:yes stop_codon:yes gene_type:complete
MKIKGKPNKIYRVNPNSVLCSPDQFNKLKEGKTVDVAEDAAEQLLNMGVVEKGKTTKKKEAK